MKSRMLAVAFALAATLVTANVVSAQCGCAQTVATSPCGGCGTVADDCGCCSPTVRYVEKTCYVNQWSTVTKTRKVTKYKTEPRTRKVMVNKWVPTKEKRTRTYCVNKMVPKTRVEKYRVAVPYTVDVEQKYNVCVPYTEKVVQKYTVCEPHYSTVKQSYKVCTPYTEVVEQKYKVCVPYTEEVEQKYVVNVPHKEERKGTRMVCKTYQEEVVQKCTKDMGSWECQTVEVACNPCGGRTGLLGRLLSRSRCDSGCGGCSDCGGCN